MTNWQTTIQAEDQTSYERPTRQTDLPAVRSIPRLLRRVVIEAVHPEIDCGRFPIKRTVGEEVVVTADVHADGHDVVVAALL